MEQPRGERRAERREEYSESFVKHTETGEYLDISKAPYMRVENHSLAVIYKHYKSTPDEPRFYWVTGMVQNTETGERLVLYKPLYKTDEKITFARPEDMFLGTAEQDGVEVKRFTPIND